MILLPIVGNAAGPSPSTVPRCGSSRLTTFSLPASPPLTEHVTAVTVSVKDKLTLSLGVAVGSSIVRLAP